jgi:SSS family solute:Na+ symporter
LIYSYEFIDSLLILTYFLILIFLGLLFSGSEKNSSEYFLAGRRGMWVETGVSLFISNLFYGYFIGAAVLGRTGEKVFGPCGGLACVALLILGWIFIPLYHDRRVHTVTEVAGNRYKGLSRSMLTGLFLVIHGFLKIIIILYAGHLLLRSLMGRGCTASLMVIVMAAGLYTIAGGMKAIYGVDLFLGSVFFVTVVLLLAYGPDLWEGVPGGISGSAPYFTGTPWIFPPHFSWVGIFIGVPMLGIVYWCVDQSVVQKVLGARSVSAARGGILLSACLFIFFAFIFVRFPYTTGAVTGSLSSEKAINTVFRTGHSLPGGLRGMLTAGSMAVLISSLASSFHSSSTLFTMDMYRRLKNRSEDKELVLVGRLVTTVMVIYTLLLVLFVRYTNTTVLDIIQRVPAYLLSPLAVVFFVGLGWKKINGNGVVSSLAAGTLLAAGRLTFEAIRGSGKTVPEWLSPLIRMPAVEFAVYSFLITGAILFSVSFFTASGPLRAKPVRVSAEGGGSGKQESRKIFKGQSIRVKIFFGISLILMIAGIFLYGNIF